MCVWHVFVEKELDILFGAPIMSVANLLSDQIVRIWVMLLKIVQKTFSCHDNIDIKRYNMVILFH